LYNQGVFGDIVVTTSRKNPPFTKQVKDKLFINIGSLGIDEELYGSKHFMTLVSIFDGDGSVGQRTKV
jgi:hypothetical protein